MTDKQYNGMTVHYVVCDVQTLDNTVGVWYNEIKKTDGWDGSMYKLKFKQGDITKSNCECIVNAANNSLLGGGGVDGAIHRAAGPELLAECRTLGGCKTGEAKITKGYALKAKWIIHTVGPIYSGAEEDAQVLASCYRNSLDLAKAHAIRSISFPAISTGAYGYPKRESVFIALNTVIQWLRDHSDYDMTVEFCSFDEFMYAYYRGIYDTMTLSLEEQYRRYYAFAAKNNVRRVGAIEMRLADEPFEKMQRGEKTVEIRLYDEKRQKIEVGDAITFYKGESRDEWISATVVGLHRFASFKELFRSDLFPKTGCGDSTPDEAAENMYRYYTREQEKQWGVLAIEIRK